MFGTSNRGPCLPLMVIDVSLPPTSYGERLPI